MKASEIIGRFGASQEADGYVAHCPAHADQHASLRIAFTDSKVLLNCRAGCTNEAVLAASGMAWSDLFDVVNDVPLSPVVRKDSRSLLPPEEQALLGGYLFAATQGDLSAAKEYALARFGVDDESFVRFGLGLDPGDIVYGRLGQLYHQAPRLVVPFKDFGGVPRGFQGRALAEAKLRWAGPTNPDTGSWTRWGFFPSDSGLDWIAICEGPGDAMTAAAAGIDAIGVRGAGLGSVAAELKPLLDGRRVVLCGDNDDAGGRFNDDLADGLDGLDVHVLVIPSAVSDITAWRESNPLSFQDDFVTAVIGSPSYTGDTLVTVASIDSFDFTTEVGCARYIKDALGGNVLWAPGLGFHIYRDGQWLRDTLHTVRSTVHELAEQLVEEGQILMTSSDQNKQTDGEKRVKAGRRIQNSKSIDNVMKELSAMVAVPSDAFDQHLDLLCVRNGVVDLRTGELMPHDRDLLMTRKVGVAYNPTAESPRWDLFLQEVFPDQPEMPSYMQRLIGYGITGRTDEQCFAIFYGTGANGKSVFTDTLAKVFKAVAETTPFSTFEERPNGGIPNDLAALRAARLVFASEGERSKPMAEAVLKRATGGDLLTARFMRGEFFSFQPEFLLLLSSNFKPSFKGQDEGLWRRIKLIPWVRHFRPEERDHYLARKLADEAEGILRWAVEGAVSWYTNGLKDPARIRDATEQYRETSDIFSGFFPGVVQFDRKSTVPGTDLYKAYVEWAESEDLAMREVMLRRTFYEAMEERGAHRVKRDNTVIFTGITLPVGQAASKPLGHGIFGGAA